MPSSQHPSSNVIALTPLRVGQRYRMPSGMGGSFDVRVIALGDAVAEVRIDMPGNPDWHAYPMTVPVERLAPIPRRFEVRTRVGKLTGKPDDFLRWSTVDTREQAEQDAKQAGYYKPCHPIQIVEVEG